MFEKKVTEEQKKQLERDIKRMNKQGRRVKNKESNQTSILKTLIIPTILAAIIVCVLYLVMEQEATQEELQTTVLCMSQDVEANTYVEAEEIEKYFEITSVELAVVPTTAIQSIDELSENGFYIQSEMAKSQMLLSEDIAEKNEVMDKYLNGYKLTSFAVESFDGGVNGSIRRGDVVNVFAMDPTTESLALMVENVYVKDVYDNSGNKITEESQIATAFTVYATESEIEQINRAVVNGGIQMYLQSK